MQQWVKRFLMTALATHIALFFFCSPQHAYGENEDITEAGDVLQIALPAIAIGSTFFAGNPEGGMWDKEGTRQSVYSVATTSAATHIWKAISGKMRPGSDARTSFPSGHTSAAFSGAAFIGTRYGWMWGLPSYGAAVRTTRSRSLVTAARSTICMTLTRKMTRRVRQRSISNTF